MKKLFLSLLIIINIVQPSYSMDRESMVHEGIRFGLPTVRGVLIGLGFASFVPIHYNFDVNFFALKKYRDYLDTKLPVNVEDINEKDKKDRVPLLYASFHGYLAGVNLLLENKADPNMKAGHKDETPLICAVSNPIYNPDLDVIRALFMHGADINMKGGWRKSTPLMYAVSVIESKKNDLKVINLLLEYKADPNVTDKYGDTPLLRAVSKKNPDFRVISLLLAYKADPNVTDEHRSTPLLEAVSQENSNLDVINSLLENKADPNVKQFDKTPLSIAVSQENSDFRVVNLLLENKGNLSTIARWQHERLNQWLSVFDMVFDRKEPSFKVIEVIIAYILKLAQQNDFSIFDRKRRNKNNEIVFFGVLDTNEKSLFDYAVEHNNKEALLKLFETARLIKSEEEAKTSLQARCMFYLVNNIDTIDLENPEQAEKLKSVFYILTAPYRTQESEITHQ